MSASGRPELTGLRLGDDPDSWRALGFAFDHSRTWLGGVCLELGVPGRGIVAWRLRGASGTDIDGLTTEAGGPSEMPAPAHPNGAVGLDHVVVATPEFARTSAALADAGLPLRRVRRVSGGARQGFRRLGPAILELVEAPDAKGPARFWGLVVIVSDLAALAVRLGDRLGPVKDAVQPGRQIATLRRSAGLGQAVAFMSPEPE